MILIKFKYNSRNRDVACDLRLATSASSRNICDVLKQYQYSVSGNRSLHVLYLTKVNMKPINIFIGWVPNLFYQNDLR